MHRRATPAKCRMIHGMYLGVDCGTQSLKVMAWDPDSESLASSFQSYDLIPGLPPGHKEQHPQTWIDALDTCMARLAGRGCRPVPGTSHRRLRAAARTRAPGPVGPGPETGQALERHQHRRPVPANTGGGRRTRRLPGGDREQSPTRIHRLQDPVGQGERARNLPPGRHHAPPSRLSEPVPDRRKDGRSGRRLRDGLLPGGP